MPENNIPFPVNWDIQPEELFPYADYDDDSAESAGYGLDELTSEDVETIYDFGDL